MFLNCLPCNYCRRHHLIIVIIHVPSRPNHQRSICNFSPLSHERELRHSQFRPTLAKSQGRTQVNPNCRKKWSDAHKSFPCPLLPVPGNMSDSEGWHMCDHQPASPRGADRQLPLCEMLNACHAPSDVMSKMLKIPKLTPKQRYAERHLNLRSPMERRVT